MPIQHRLRTYPLLEMAATLQEMPDETSVWIEGLGAPYRWGDLRAFRREAADLLGYERPSYPAVVKIETRIHPVGGLDVYGDRVAILVLPEMAAPDLSRPRGAALPH